jgi:cell division protein FtsW (lipid II flippase)
VSPSRTRLLLRTVWPFLALLLTFIAGAVITAAAIAFIVLYPDIGTVLACGTIVLLVVIEALKGRS